MPCYVCGGNGDKWGPGHEYCARCRFAWRTVIPETVELDAIHEACYDENTLNNGSTNQLSPLFSVRSLSNWFARQFPPFGLRLLDFGSGTGELVSEMRLLGYSCDGVEASPSARRHALKRGIDLCPDLNSIRDEVKYDVVIMHEVIEHLSDPVATLKGLKGKLKSGGMIYISTPNVLGLKARMSKWEWSEAKKPFHVFLFSARSLRACLEKAGMVRVRNITYSHVTAPGLFVAIRSRALQTLGVHGSLRMMGWA